MLGGLGAIGRFRCPSTARESSWCGARLALGAVDPETADLSADALANYQQLIHEPIAFQLKTEIQTHRDVEAFRSRRR